MARDVLFCEIEKGFYEVEIKRCLLILHTLSKASKKDDGPWRTKNYTKSRINIKYLENFSCS